MPSFEIASICAYFQQVGHEFKICPFVDDKLQQLMRKELKTFLQLVVPNIPTTHVSVHVLLVTIGKFDPNLVLVNINKLKPYRFVEDRTFQPILAKPSDLLPIKSVETS